MGWIEKQLVFVKTTDLMLGFFPPNRYGLVLKNHLGTWMMDDDRDCVGMTHVMPLPEPPNTGDQILKE